MKIFVSKRIISIVFWIAMMILASISILTYSRIHLDEFLVVASGDILSFSTLFFVYYFLSRETKEHKLADEAKIGNGKAVRMFGTAQDITDRKMAEEKLKESDKKLKEEIIILNDALTLREAAEKELNKKIHDLEVFHQAEVGRELQMIELKKRNAELESGIKALKK
ncbi:hypothetical protein HZC34_06100 [Candidatus Saganbacteria bacterium]|nr:hypothetical protein [Candidatus Saganbacteria bacterium]